MGGKKAGCLLSEMLCIKLEHIVPYLTDIWSRKNSSLFEVIDYPLLSRENS